ncbi:hypothetical protein R3W88_019122 [Solanum pinnatisectum]|uniref:Retrotransposon gag domain-containing protein n=1 Tax=Solanum pinnatisectum TaxID=50273 RepID=A0AAV9KIH3_9SOLN|nr:hypothetical protein R3W88_019122 [Solanum pinnatisectum]
MAKGTRSTYNSPTEMGELKEMMQNLAEKMETLVGEVTNLKRLDQVVMELKEHLVTNRESGREKTHMEDVPSTAIHSDEGIHHSEGRSYRPRSPTSYNTHHSNFSRWSRTEFLMFAGEDLRSWLFKIEQFFSMENVAAEEKVTVDVMQLEGKAIQWHLSFMRYGQYLQPATWNEYVMAMVERFGTDFDDPIEEIKKIKQMGSVKEYQSSNAISCFIGGLKHELNIVVKITNPTSLSQVYKTARMQETYLTAVNRRTLSIEEMNEKKAKGLCYFCNEKYMPGHKCKNSKQLYLLEVEELEEEQDSMQEQGGELQEEQNEQLELGPPVEHMEISMYALNRSLRFRTLKVTGYHSKMALHILIATGSSHNFIDPNLVKKLGCEVKSIKPKILLTLGDIKLNFRNLIMEFWYKGMKHLLRGSGSQRLYRCPSVKKDIIEGLVQQMLDQGII